MGLFSRQPRTCPICSADLQRSDGNEVVGHVLLHIDDAVRGNPSSGLRLACGCADAVWMVGENFPQLAKEHLEQAHGMRR